MSDPRIRLIEELRDELRDTAERCVGTYRTLRVKIADELDAILNQIILPPPMTNATAQPPTSESVSHPPITAETLPEFLAWFDSTEHPDPYEGNGYVETLRKVAVAYSRHMGKHHDSESVSREDVALLSGLAEQFVLEFGRDHAATKLVLAALDEADRRSSASPDGYVSVREAPLRRALAALDSDADLQTDALSPVVDFVRESIKEALGDLPLGYTERGSLIGHEPGPENFPEEAGEPESLLMEALRQTAPFYHQLHGVHGASGVVEDSHRAFADCSIEPCPSFRAITQSREKE